MPPVRRQPRTRMQPMSEFALKTSLPQYLRVEQEKIQKIAQEEGLDFFPIVFEMLTYDQMNEVAAYGGFPNRYPHWRFGMEYERLAKSPGIEGVWQGHLSLFDRDHNTAPEMIANLEDTDQCQGHWLKASVSRDGRFTMTNGRNGFSKSYKAR